MTKIGANPNKIETWQPIVEAMRSRLTRWNNKHLSIGGQVVIMKSDLYALQDYFLSFFKASKSIISKLQYLFKQFLRGAVENDTKIYWVHWDKIYRFIEEGGLEIRILKVFNIALLKKWEWKIEFEKSGLWFKTLLNIYGGSDDSIIIKDRGVFSWWKTLSQLNSGMRYSASIYSVREAYKEHMSHIFNPSNLLWSKAWNKAVPLNVAYLAWRIF